MRRPLACVLSVMVGAALAAAETVPDRRLAAWQAYAAAKQAWHQDLAVFLIRHQPDLRELIELDRDLQLAQVAWRGVRLRYLADAKPERLIIDKGILQFVNFAWSEPETQALIAANPDAADAQARLTGLEARAKDHPQWPALRQAFLLLQHAPEYQALHQDLQRTIADAETLLTGGS